jgi:hypothetical protein
MLRVVLILFCITTGTAMAKPTNIPEPYTPLNQVPTPEGGFRDQGARPSRAELGIQMWRQYMGDKPIPDRMRKRYGIPDDVK